MTVTGKDEMSRDFLARAGEALRGAPDPSRYFMEFRISRDSRRPHLQALLADALLSAAASAKEAGLTPLAVVGAPSISDSIASQLHDYAKHVAADMAYGLIDSRGRLELFDPGVGWLHRTSERGPPAKASAARRGENLFTDVRQWMLKVLLSGQLQPGLLGIRAESIRSATELGREAGVAPSTATEFVAALRDQGFVDHSTGVVRLVRLRQLLELWATQPSRDSDVGMRWALPGPDTETRAETVVLALGKLHVRACLGMFAASRRLGFGFVSGVPPHVYADLNAAEPARLKEQGLRRARPGELLQVVLGRPAFLESVFRGVLTVSESRVCDVIQCWLDTARHPARGAEQAAVLWDRVIYPQLVQAAE